jgi:hypothetical protein
VLTIDERAKISRMQGDLRWLVTEGYVTEFIDGRLFAPPPMVEARKKEVEGEEHDPENFPEVPPSAETAAAPPAPAKSESAPAPAPSETPASASPAPIETTLPAPGEPDIAVPADAANVAEPVVPAAPEQGAEQKKEGESQASSAGA